MNRYKATIQTWDKIALQYQDKFMEMDLYNDTYDRFCTAVAKPNATIFEIGCGPGNITKYLQSQRPDFKITATDAAPSMVALAQQHIPTAEFKVMDCREIDTLTAQFDAIVCGFCMPYLSKEDCQKLIADSATLLENDGVIYFSAIEGDYSKSGYETSSDGQHTLFVYYHQEDYLMAALVENNFEIIALERKTYPKKDEIGIHIIFIAKKKNLSVVHRTICIFGCFNFQFTSKNLMQNIINRFITYVTIDTESDPNSKTTPSTKKTISISEIASQRTSNYRNDRSDY